MSEYHSHHYQQAKKIQMNLKTMSVFIWQTGIQVLDQQWCSECRPVHMADQESGMQSPPTTVHPTALDMSEVV